MAQSPAELVDALRRFRTRAGDPSFREMAIRSGQAVTVTAIWEVLARGDFPARFHVLDAIVVGCGGSKEDRQPFAAAWVRLTSPAHHAAAAKPPQLYIVPPAQELP